MGVLYLYGVNDVVLRVLQSSGQIDEIGSNNVQSVHIMPAGEGSSDTSLTVSWLAQKKDV